MLAENKDLVRRAFEVLWNEVNLTEIDELFAVGYLFNKWGPTGVADPLKAGS